MRSKHATIVSTDQTDLVLADQLSAIDLVSRIEAGRSRLKTTSIIMSETPNESVPESQIVGATFMYIELSGWAVWILLGRDKAIDD